MRRQCFALGLFAVVLTTAAMPARAQDPVELFVVATSGDAQTQATAMILASETLEKSTPVRVLLKTICACDFS